MHTLVLGTWNGFFINTKLLQNQDQTSSNLLTTLSLQTTIVKTSCEQGSQLHKLVSEQQHWQSEKWQKTFPSINLPQYQYTNKNTKHPYFARRNQLTCTNLFSLNQNNPQNHYNILPWRKTPFHQWYKPLLQSMLQKQKPLPRTLQQCLNTPLWQGTYTRSQTARISPNLAVPRYKKPGMNNAHITQMNLGAPKGSKPGTSPRPNFHVYRCISLEVI